ncbi:MAG: hypothetical protein U1F57_07205 [bacterium]
MARFVQLYQLHRVAQVKMEDLVLNDAMEGGEVFRGDEEVDSGGKMTVSRVSAAERLFGQGLGGTVGLPEKTALLGQRLQTEKFDDLIRPHDGEA